MTKLSKKEKGWTVVSVVWFLITTIIAGANASGGDALQEFLGITIGLNIPLIIGWGIWWVKHD